MEECWVAGGLLSDLDKKYTNNMNSDVTIDSPISEGIDKDSGKNTNNSCCWNLKGQYTSTSST